MLFNVVKWGITSKCNLNCRHCFIGDEISCNDDISLKKALSLVSKLVKVGAKSIVFATMEPLLYEGIFELIDYCSQLNLQTTIITNGAVLTNRETATRLVRSGISNIFISLEGISEASQDRIRGSGMLENVLIALKNIEESQIKGMRIPIGIRMTMNRLNLSGMERIPEFINRLPVDSLRLSDVSLQGSAKENETLKLSHEELNIAWNCLFSGYNRLENKNYSLMFMSLSPLEVVYSNMFGEKDIYPAPVGCSFASDGSICVMENGKVTLCDLVLRNDSLSDEMKMPIIDPIVIQPKKTLFQNTNKFHPV